MRDKIWDFALRNHPEAMILTKRLIAIRWILFPLRSFYWHMQSTEGYEVMTDTWSIEGVRYSGRAMRVFANANGEHYRIWNKDGVVTLERIIEDDCYTTDAAYLD